MSDKPPTKTTAAPGRDPDFARQMARAELGRHYIDVGRLEQTLKHGEIVLGEKPRPRQTRP